MKKLGCAKCGGTKKMKLGGTNNVNISKPGAGFAKETKGDTNQKMGIYGIAQTGPTGPNNSGIATMKKGGTKKEHPITTFRKANDARNAMVMKSLPKAKDGVSTLATELYGTKKETIGKNVNTNRVLDNKGRIIGSRPTKMSTSSKISGNNSNVTNTPLFKKKGGVVKSKKK